MPFICYAHDCRIFPVLFLQLPTNFPKNWIKLSNKLKLNWIFSVKLEFSLTCTLYLSQMKNKIKFFLRKLVQNVFQTIFVINKSVCSKPIYKKKKIKQQHQHTNTNAIQKSTLYVLSWRCDGTRVTVKLITHRVTRLPL